MALLFACAGCAETIQHDEALAAKRAIEFARAALIDKNFAKSYELMSPSGKRHISMAKLQETVASFHPREFPSKVTALEFQPMPGEKALWIYLVGQNAQEQFHYRFTMEGTAGGDYRLLTLDSGVVGRFFSPTSEKHPFKTPLSTQP